MAAQIAEEPVVIRNSGALGTALDGSCSELKLDGARSIFQVKIQWKRILLDTVQRLGVANTVYSEEETSGAMFQIRVSFSVPLNTSRSKFKEIAVVGGKCSTLPEAESEASALALQELQHGCASIRILDVSRMRFKELGNYCQEIHTSSTDTYHAVKSVLSDWEDMMNRTERCYSPDREKVLSNNSNRAYKPYGDMSPDVASHLAKLVSTYYAKLKMLTAETDVLKKRIDKSHEYAEYFFFESSLYQIDDCQENTTLEAEIHMKLVLEEMMTSLGWARPLFKVACSDTGFYDCETTLFPRRGNADEAPKIITATGLESKSKEEALESSCRAAILSLEINESIYLLDLNYEDRAHSKLHVIQAEEMNRLASLLGCKVLTDWETMLNGIQACQSYCQRVTEEHPAEEQSTSMYRAKWNSSKAVAGLHKACTLDLQTARNRLKKFTTSMKGY